MKNSLHLNDIVEKHNRISTMLIVFVDIEKYSKRKTSRQISIIDRLTEAITTSIDNISKKYISYCQKNSLNFSTDIIKLPTGDGAALVFPFEGLHDIHIEFAKDLIDLISKNNISSNCVKFIDNGWCNCHSNFNITVGISEGKGILYKDINDNYNVAGGVINMAARVMNLADRNQIMITEDAYKQIVELDSRDEIVDNFVKFEVKIKHDLKISVYQYIDIESSSINNNPPKGIEFAERSKAAMALVKKSGFPMIGMASDFDDAMESIDRDSMMSVIENIAKLMSDSGILKTKTIENRGN